MMTWRYAKLLKCSHPAVMKLPLIAALEQSGYTRKIRIIEEFVTNCIIADVRIPVHKEKTLHLDRALVIFIYGWWAVVSYRIFTAIMYAPCGVILACRQTASLAVETIKKLPPFPEGFPIEPVNTYEEFVAALKAMRRAKDYALVKRILNNEGG